MHFRPQRKSQLLVRSGNRARRLRGDAVVTLTHHPVHTYIGRI